MPIVYTILDFLLIGWLFWPLALIPLITCYYIIDRATDRHSDWPGWPTFWLLLVGGAVLYRYPSARLTWHGTAWAVAAYVAAGFGVALYKWLAVLIAFRKGDVKGDIAKAKQKNSSPLQAAIALGSRDYSYQNCIVERDPATDVIVIYPDWRKQPIAAWASYWPFFVLSIPFDWLTHLADILTTWLKQFWDGIARHFSVKG